MSEFNDGVTDGDLASSGVTASQFELLGVRTAGIKLATSGLPLLTRSSYTRS